MIVKSITKKELRENYAYIVRVGYCDLATITRELPKIGYASGVYGWNWSAYELRGNDGGTVAICTGYRDLAGERVEGLAKYEQKARKIAEDWETLYKDKQKQIKRLLQNLYKYIIRELKKNEK